MAQLVEQLIRNQQVAGSNPAISSKKIRTKKIRSYFLLYDGFEPRFARAQRRFTEGSRLLDRAITAISYNNTF